MQIHKHIYDSQIKLSTCVNTFAEDLGFLGFREKPIETLFYMFDAVHAMLECIANTSTNAHC